VVMRGVGGDGGIEWTLDDGKKAQAEGRAEGIDGKHISKANMQSIPIKPSYHFTILIPLYLICLSAMRRLWITLSVLMPCTLLPTIGEKSPVVTIGAIHGVGSIPMLPIPLPSRLVFSCCSQVV